MFGEKGLNFTLVQHFASFLVWNKMGLPRCAQTEIFAK